MHWMTPKWTQGIRDEKYTIYAVHKTVSPKCTSFSLYDKPFHDIAHFSMFPWTTVLQMKEMF